ncbi:MAG: prepilin-type N-terminal cleavage/methylation domain-containing protein, partial [Planctomycetota bacterium]
MAAKRSAAWRACRRSILQGDRFMSSKRAFTLIELLVVIAIIA